MRSSVVQDWDLRTRPDSPRAAANGSLPAPREMVGESRHIDHLRRLTTQVAPKKAPLLIHGESGTGKEVLARQVYAHSARAGQPFVAINCAAIPESLVESEMFGHERGAFSGAVALRRGCFEEADGGTLFLDEVTEIRPHVQAKLLRVLQESEIRRVGGTRTHAVDVRIIAATSRDPHQAMRDGVLREDLYYRLATVELFIPPLRERKDDLRPLARFFLARHGAQNGSALRDVGDEALRLLNGYGWPGNVRELENVMARATVLAAPDEGDRVLPHHLPPAIQGLAAPWRPGAPAPAEHDAARAPADLGEDLRAALAQVRRSYVHEALRRANGNKAEAARLLGVSRRGFYNLLGGDESRPRPALV
ncbi:MAG TPA: sigma-54 dependent transcriptional regulator [Longimicrobium sp.]|nr:sigma-54 dependent transcriptional regulator [Longimicrobium sp.]